MWFLTEVFFRWRITYAVRLKRKAGTSFFKQLTAGNCSRQISGFRFTLIIVVMLFSASIAEANPDREYYKFNIPGQDVEAALVELASNVNVFLLFPYDSVKPATSNSVNGTYKIGEALNILLKGTGLAGSLTEGGVITISQLNSVKNNDQGKTMKNRKSKNLAVALLSAFGVSGMVDAQTSAVQLEEIIVTAQKRSENLQDVPISIATVSEERFSAITDAGGDITALAGRVPSLYVEGSSGRTAPRFYIRGLGNVDFDLNASQPVSLIMDEVVMENVLFKGFPLFDVQQVEVLRGPQGTLFGRNTPAGIVKFDTKKPTEEFEGSAGLSYGSYGSSVLTAAIGGGLGGGWSGRIALFDNRRDDWVTNAATDAIDGTPSGADVLGGHEETAARVHIAYESDNFSLLGTVQTRTLDATTTLFRANALSAGSNNLNSSFNRRTVFFDNGLGNPSEVDSTGVNLKMVWDIGDMSITSITSRLDGSSFGLSDVDGGNNISDIFVPGDFNNTGPNKFDAATGTSDSDLEQFTQEIRIASESDSAVQWQAGLFFFSDEFDLDSISLSSAAPDPSSGTFQGFANNTIRRVINNVQKTDASAIFGQLSWDVSDSLTFTGGLRYSEDEKTLDGVVITGSGQGGVNGPIRIEVEDDHVSWDLSLTYLVSDDTTVYGRIANGYRGPSIQGRQLNQVSTAQSETVDSIEIGFKSEFGNRLRLNAAAFYYEVDNQQLTAIGGLGNFNQLINIDKGVGQGFEVDMEWAATDNFYLTAGYSLNDTEIQDANAIIAACNGGCTPTDPQVSAGFAPFVSSTVNINGNPFPQSPEQIFTITGRYTIDLAGGAEIYVFGDWNWQGETNFFLYESEEFNSDGNNELGLRVGYVSADRDLEVAFFGRNLTDQENVLGGIDFTNLSAYVNEPRVVGAELSYNF